MIDRRHFRTFSAMREAAIRSSIALAICAVAAFPATGAEKVGGVNRIVNVVTGGGVVGERTLAGQDPVYRNEDISAKAASRGELLLDDDSRIIVGENSTITLDNFVVAGDSFSSGTINVAKGAFRFISGNSPKGAIKVKTPLSTIGLRGTIFDVYVSQGGLTRVVLLQGQLTACARSGQCLNLNRACDIVEIKGPSDIEEIPFLRSAARTRPQEAALFDLTEAQQRHSRRWRAFESACSARAAEEIQRRSPNPFADPSEPEAEPDTPGDDEGEDW